MRATTGPPAAKLGAMPTLVVGMPVETAEHAHDERGHGTHDFECRKGRRGVAVLVVLLLLAITLAVSYATMRSQSTALTIQKNASLGAAARQAALTGMTIGLKQMHTGDWTGVDSALNGSLGDGTSYEVTYFAGDASLAPGDPDYAELPYRVTVLATGQAVDATDPNRAATHQIRVVVGLVPRDLGPQPVDWTTMQRYTVYQTKDDRFEVDIPSRIEGPVRAQRALRVALHYPNDNNARDRYLTDLNAMRTNLQLDYRPFTGPIDFPRLAQTGQQLGGLENKLGVTLNDGPTQEVAADFTKPALPSSYQLYQGGPSYEIPRVLTNPLENVTLEADPVSNPLGLFYREMNLAIRNNVTIRGSLICHGDVKIEGTNVHFTSVDMPSLHGSTAPLRLPVLSCQHFHVRAGAGGSLTGLLAAFSDFKVEKSSDTVTFLITGRVIARMLFIKERQPWDTENWSSRYNAFMTQLNDNQSNVRPVPYFPLWLKQFGLDPKPLIQIVPDPTPVDYRWKMSYDTIFLPHADDASPQDPNNPGLRWDLLEWTDRP